MKAPASVSNFESTIPFGEPELMRASEYRQYLEELEADAAANGVSSRISSLSPSLRADLYRFEADGGSSEVLEVVAACVRHAKRVTIHLQFDERVLPLTVFPDVRLVHCPLSIDQLLVALAGGDFAQRHHGRLVLVLGVVEGRLDAGRQLAGALGGHQDQLEAVLDDVQAIFDGDAGHS